MNQHKLKKHEAPLEIKPPPKYPTGYLVPSRHHA